MSDNVLEDLWVEYMAKGGDAREVWDFILWAGPLVEPRIASQLAKQIQVEARDWSGEQALGLFRAADLIDPEIT